MPPFRKFIVATAAGLAATAFALQSALAFDANNKADLEKFIHDYIVSHPEILLEAQDALQAKQEAALRAQTKAVIAKNTKPLFHAPGDLVVGNPKGNVTVVEFFDYNCTYCRNHALKAMNVLLDSDKNVRYVFKEFPILGADSVAASQVSMAVEAVAPDKFRTFHDMLLGGSGPATKESALAIAAKLGIDRKALALEMGNPSIGTRIRQNYALAQALHITGTPGYVIGDEALSGVIDAKVLEKKIANVRKCDSTVC